MALAAVLAVAIADLTAPAKSLRMDGVDLLPTVSKTSQFTVPIETISLTEEGPGGVSSLDFTIADPLAEFTMQEMAVVTFWDHTDNRPLFQGWMESFGVDPWAAQGRNITVHCVGVESLLDWMLVPSLTIPVNTPVHTAYQACVANATGVGWPIRAVAYDSSGFRGETSTQQYPIGYYPNILAQDVVLAGTSLREALNQVTIAASSPSSGVYFAPPGDAQSASATIDFTSGLRVTPTYLTFNILNVAQPSDYSTLTIQDTTAGTYASTGLNFAVDTGGVIREVYVTGASPAASGLFTDGSGITGPVAQLNDSTITTLLGANLAASDYLFQFATSVRGSFTLDPTPVGFIASGNYRAGAAVTIKADSQVVLADLTFIIAAIHKSWQPGAESWAVDFGGFRPSAMKQIRRLTRGIRS
jgi:hypothetical protein